MKHVNSLAKSASTQESTQHSTTNTSELSELEKETVRRFFASIKALYGAARYQASWPTQKEEAAAMRLWSRDLLAYSWSELNAKLQTAKARMHMPEWRHPDVAMILNGVKQPGASGQAALSYRPVDEVVGLPAPEMDKAAGRAALAKIRAGL